MIISLENLNSGLAWWRAKSNWGSDVMNSKAKIAALGAARLEEIEAEYQKLAVRSSTEPCIADHDWEKVAPWYCLAYEIKSSPVFAGKMCGGPVCSDRFFGFLSGIIARRNRGGGNVKISFIDFQGLREGRETVLSFSVLSTDRHFHGRLRCALCRPC